MAPPIRLTTVTEAAESIDLITLAVAKDELGILSGTTTYDTQIERMITQVSSAINSCCNRVFAIQSYRDQFRNTCDWLGYGNPLTLSSAPVAVDGGGLAVLTVTEDGTAVVLAEWQADLGAGFLYRLDSAGSFSSWSGSLIQVDYDAGYAVIPDDVQAAALELLSARWNTKGRDPTLRSINIPDVVAEAYWVDPNAPGMPAGVMEKLGPYRIWAI